MELLFGGVEEAKIAVTSGVEGQNVQIRHVIAHVRDHLLKERPDLFVTGETVYVCSARQ
jgi:hypothetical protein